MNYRLCLVGGKELHNAIISSIQDLAKAVSSYNEEIMVHPDFPLHVLSSVGLFYYVVFISDPAVHFRARKNTFFSMLEML